MAQIATRPTSPIACATRFMKSRSARIQAGVVALSRARVTQCDSICFLPNTGSSTTAFNSRMTSPRGSGVDSMRAGRDASAATQVSAGRIARTTTIAASAAAAATGERAPA